MVGIGLLLGVFAIFGSFLMEGGKIGGLILIPAMVIVFVGTAATAIIGTPKDIVLKAHLFVKLALFPPKYELEKMINLIVDLSIIARKEGILSLESKASEIDHPFFKKLVLLAVDGTEPEALQEIAEMEISGITERHMANASLFQKMGGYSPTMGIIGTVMGLISTLANAGEDATTLVHHIASAFIATLWGVFMANIVFLPLCDRLKAMHAEEKLLLDIFVQGITSIQSGENQVITKTKLYAMLPNSVQKKNAEEAEKTE